MDVVDPVPSRPSSRQGGSSNRVGVDALELARRLRVTADEAESNFVGDRDSKAGKAAAAVDDASEAPKGPPARRGVRLARLGRQRARRANDDALSDGTTRTLAMWLQAVFDDAER